MPDAAAALCLGCAGDSGAIAAQHNCWRRGALGEFLAQEAHLRGGVHLVQHQPGVVGADPPWHLGLRTTKHR